jgi:hypothetical protein
MASFFIENDTTTCLLERQHVHYKIYGNIHNGNMSFLIKSYSQDSENLEIFNSQTDFVDWLNGTIRADKAGHFLKSFLKRFDIYESDNFSLSFLLGEQYKYFVGLDWEEAEERKSQEGHSLS